MPCPVSCAETGETQKRKGSPEGLPFFAAWREVRRCTPMLGGQVLARQMAAQREEDLSGHQGLFTILR